MIHPDLFKRDRTGRVRRWCILSEPGSARYAYQTGILDGVQTQSGWTTVTGKQGRTDAGQVEFEVAAAYRHQLERDYFETIEEIDTPRIFEPMLASKYKAFKPGFAQPKLDGMRCIAKATGLFSRQGKPILSAPHIIEALTAFFERFPDAILDGELYNHDFKEAFEPLMSLARKGYPSPGSENLQYHVYDYPSAPGGFKDRFHQLVIDLPRNDTLHLVETHRVRDEATFDALTNKWLDDKYEGSMWRDADGEYVIAGRPKFLQKRVIMTVEEYDFVELVLGNGNWAGIPKSVVCWKPGADRSMGPTKDNTFSAGIAGTEAENMALLDRRIGQVTIQSKGLTGYGVPRCGVAKDWHGPEGRVD